MAWFDSNRIGVLFLCIFLVLFAIFALTNVTIALGHVLEGVAALLAAIFLGLGLFNRKT